MNTYVNLKTITPEQIEQNTEKVTKRTSNTATQTVYQTTINNRHIITWYENEENVYYYLIGRTLACIGTTDNYNDFIKLIHRFFNKTQTV